MPHPTTTTTDPRASTARERTLPADDGTVVLRGAGEEMLGFGPDANIPPCTCDHEDGPCRCERARAIKATRLRRG
jgi:hypothetical protein